MLSVVDRRVLEVDLELDFLPTSLGGFSTKTRVYKRLSELTFFPRVALVELYPGGKNRTLRDEN